MRSATPFSEVMRPVSRVCIQLFTAGDLSMHRSQKWLQFSITILMFAVASFAKKKHVPNPTGLSVEEDQRRQAMSFSVSTLLTRNLHDVFGENDPARRRVAIDEIFTEDCVFYEPRGAYHGRDEIDRVAGTIKAT